MLAVVRAKHAATCTRKSNVLGVELLCRDMNHRRRFPWGGEAAVSRLHFEFTMLGHRFTSIQRRSRHHHMSALNWTRSSPMFCRDAFSGEGLLEVL